MAHNNQTRRMVLKTAGAAGVVGLAGCLGDGDDDTDDTGTDDTGTDDTGTDDTGTDDTGDDAGGREMMSSARIALEDDPTIETWNFYGGVTPYFTNILEPLVWVDRDMEIQPWLAEDWEQVEDTVWEFSLREGVEFHNGEEMVADHVVFSLEAILEEWVWAGPDWRIEEGEIEAVDDYTVRIGTIGEFPTFPANIAHNMIAIQHPDREHAPDGPVIGTGPFEVENINVGQEVTVSKFDNYWNEEATLEELTFEVIADPNTRSLNLQNRDIEVAMAPPRSQVPSLQDDENINIQSQETTRAGSARLNIHKSPTDDVQLRRAFNYAIDQETIVNTIFEGIGQPARGPFSPAIFWSAHDDLPEYGPDLDQAQDLVAESSYDGEELTILLPEDLTDGREIAQILQSSFSDIGVESEILVLERAAFTEAERDGEAHVIMDTSGANSGDADYIVFAGYHSQGDVNERLYGEEGTGLHNLGSEIDDLIEQAQRTGDMDEKVDLFGEVQHRIMDEAVVIPLWYETFIIGSHDRVDGIELGAIPQFIRWTSLEHWE